MRFDTYALTAAFFGLVACSADDIDSYRLGEPERAPEMVEQDDGTTMIDGRIVLEKPQIVDFEVIRDDQHVFENTKLSRLVGQNASAVFEQETGRLIVQSADADIARDYREHWVVTSENTVILGTGVGERTIDGRFLDDFSVISPPSRVVFVETADATLAIDLVSGREYAFDFESARYSSLDGPPVAIMSQGDVFSVIDLRGEAAAEPLPIGSGTFARDSAVAVGDNVVLVEDFSNNQVVEVDLDARTVRSHTSWTRLIPLGVNANAMPGVGLVQTSDGRVVARTGERTVDATCERAGAYTRWGPENLLIHCDDGRFLAIDLTRADSEFDVVENVVGVTYAGIVVSRRSDRLVMSKPIGGVFETLSDPPATELPLQWVGPIGERDWVMFHNEQAEGEPVAVTVVDPSTGTVFDTPTGSCNILAARRPDGPQLAYFNGSQVVIHSANEATTAFEAEHCGFAWNGKQLAFFDDLELVWTQLESGSEKRVLFDQAMSVSMTYMRGLRTNALWMLRPQQFDSIRTVMMDLQSGDMVDFGTLSLERFRERAYVSRMDDVYVIPTEQNLFVGARDFGLDHITSISDDRDARVVGHKVLYRVTPLGDGRSEVRKVSVVRNPFDAPTEQ